MLDVHPPHAPTHTWRDFLLHIATICVGLLIAVGLEQTVEAIHRHNERRELIANFRAECEDNVKILTTNLDSYRVQSAWNLAAVNALRNAPLQQGYVDVTLPAATHFPLTIGPSRTVWSVATSSARIALLPEDLSEVFDRVEHEASEFYRVSTLRNDTSHSVSELGTVLGTPLRPGAVLHLTPAQRDQAATVLAHQKENVDQCALWDSVWLGASQSVLHDVHKRSDMEPYINRARAPLDRI